MWTPIANALAALLAMASTAAQSAASVLSTAASTASDAAHGSSSSPHASLQFSGEVLDPLNDVGLSHGSKMQYWLVYVIFNFIGCIFCLFLITSVARLATRSSSDILAAALCFSCFVMSFSCGTQCLMNVMAGRFAHGTSACYVEALFHLISIVTMFFILTVMAYDSHRTVVKGESMGVKKALWCTLGVWVLSSTGIGLFSLGSSIYMSPSGVFCFFKFDSMLMYSFFLPAFLIAAGAMIFFYFKIFALTRAALKRMGTTLNVTDNRKRIQMRLAQKLFLFVVVFLVGWIGLVLGILLQLATGSIFELDAIGGVTGVLHTLAVPITYGLINPRLRSHMLSTMSCGLCVFRSKGSVHAADQSRLSTADTAPGKTSKGGEKSAGTVAGSSRKGIVRGGSHNGQEESLVANNSTLMPPGAGRQGSFMLSVSRTSALNQGRSGSPIGNSPANSPLGPMAVRKTSAADATQVEMESMELPNSVTDATRMASLSTATNEAARSDSPVTSPNSRGRELALPRAGSPAFTQSPNSPLRRMNSSFTNGQNNGRTSPFKPSSRRTEQQNNISKIAGRQSIQESTPLPPLSPQEPALRAPSMDLQELVLPEPAMLSPVSSDAVGVSSDTVVHELSPKSNSDMVEQQ